jgi:hypothetical protein
VKIIDDIALDEQPDGQRELVVQVREANAPVLTLSLSFRVERVTSRASV